MSVAGCGGIGRWVVALGGALLIYSAFLLAKGADPVDALECDVGLVVRYADSARRDPHPG